jgi:hypothetical protein
MKAFVVDAMLGRLATWLRLVGCDTYYSPDTGDAGLLRLAREQDRVLLTADARLCERAEKEGVECLLARDNVDERVAAVFAEYEIEPVADPRKSRCTKCGGILTHIPEEEKERVRDLVHQQTHEFYTEFWLCEECSSVFFRGGQWKNIEKYMKRISELMGQ